MRETLVTGPLEALSEAILTKGVAMADDDGDESHLGNSVLPDPDADRRFSNMLFDLVGQVKDAQARGLSPRDILDPASGHYIGDRLLRAHTPTRAETLASYARQLGQQSPVLRQPYEQLAAISIGRALRNQPIPLARRQLIRPRNQ